MMGFKYIHLNQASPDIAALDDDLGDADTEQTSDAFDLLADSEKLEIPSDHDVCDKIAKHWEKYGFGSHQVHWDNQGRSPANEGEVRENRLSRNIRQRIWKIDQIQPSFRF